MSSPFKSRAVAGDPKENRRRKWLPVLVLAAAVLIAAASKVATANRFLQGQVVKTGGYISALLVDRRSDFPSLDRGDSLRWGVVAQQAAAAFGQRNVIVGHIITFLLVTLSCGLGFVVLRNIRDVAAAKGSRKGNGYLNPEADEKKNFTLGEATGAKDDHNTVFRIEPREYELGIDPSGDQFTTAQPSTLEPEWKL
jgi:hypothetical protein